MSIRFHSTVLLTSDVRRLSAFYTDTLGQTVQHDFGTCIILHGGLSFWQVSDDLTVSVKLGYTSHPSGNKNLELCFETETLEADVKRVMASGVQQLHDLVEEPWGQRVLRFFDPDGNLVELGESIPTFVQRHYAGGLSIEAVAMKTGVPVDTVRQLVKGCHQETVETNDQPIVSVQSYRTPTVSLQAVVDEMDIAGDECSTYLNKHTGELVTIGSEEAGLAEVEDADIEDRPEWQQDAIIQAQEVLGSDDYLLLPSSFDIHEYSILEEFCRSIEDEELCDSLLRMIRGSGAFRRFKDAIHRHGIADNWHKFRQTALEEIAAEWLEANEIPYSRDAQNE